MNRSMRKMLYRNGIMLYLSGKTLWAVWKNDGL